MSTIKLEPGKRAWNAMQRAARKYSRATLSLMLACQMVSAQQPPRPPGAGQTPPAGQAAGAQGDPLRPNYTLGPNDQIMIRAQDAEEIGEKPYRIEGDGSVNLPMVGKIQAGGLTIVELESQLVERLRSFIRNPQVIVTVVQFRSEPIFLVGAFQSPGIHPLQGRRTLLEMLTGVGGLLPNASRRIKVTRRMEYGPLPLPGVVEDAESRLSSAEVNLGTLMETVNPAADIQLMPFDILKASTAELVYVAGEVLRVGTLELQGRESLSASQAITMSGGLSPMAKPERAYILRPILDTTRRAEIPVDLKKILAGGANDFPLLPNDVLYIPRAQSLSATVWRNAIVLAPIATALLVVFVRR